MDSAVTAGDEDFAAAVARRLERIPGTVAVTLGGSRAQGEHRPDSDWDFGLYYRGRLDPADVRALGWPGTVAAPGEWGGGVMNGGAWLTVEGRRVDVMYRDLGEVEHWVAEAEQGRFAVERLPFYLAGIPTYVVVGELAISQVLSGRLPRPAYPSALRRTALRFWGECARLTLDYAEANYVPRADALGCAGALARAAVEAAHARLAERGIWALNEKRIVANAGLDGLTALFTRLGGTRDELHEAVEAVRAGIASPRD
jgi:predicted nucleotidyltransferase